MSQRLEMQGITPSVALADLAEGLGRRAEPDPWSECVGVKTDLVARDEELDPRIGGLLRHRISKVQQDVRAIEVQQGRAAFREAQQSPQNYAVPASSKCRTGTDSRLGVPPPRRCPRRSSTRRGTRQAPRRPPRTTGPQCDQMRSGHLQAEDFRGTL